MAISVNYFKEQLDKASNEMTLASQWFIKSLVNDLVTKIDKFILDCAKEGEASFRVDLANFSNNINYRIIEKVVKVYSEVGWLIKKEGTVLNFSLPDSLD